MNECAGVSEGRDLAHRNMENRAGAGAHDLRARGVHRARHGDDTDGPKRIGRANDRADVAGVAPLGENDEGLPHARLR